MLRVKGFMPNRLVEVILKDHLRYLKKEFEKPSDLYKNILKNKGL